MDQINNENIKQKYDDDDLEVFLKWKRHYDHLIKHLSTEPHFEDLFEEAPDLVEHIKEYEKKIKLKIDIC